MSVSVKSAFHSTTLYWKTSNNNKYEKDARVMECLIDDAWMNRCGGVLLKCRDNYVATPTTRDFQTMGSRKVQYELITTNL